MRTDPEALTGLLNWRARLLKLDGLSPVIGQDGALEWGTLADAPDDAELVFLGMEDGKACFAAVPANGAGGPAYADPAIWSAMRTLPPSDLATYGGARSLVDWHARHRFCARCGAATRLAKGGWQRDCPICEAQHFPRTDPVTIMLVEHDGQLLLGRQPRFPERMYSALAGFVEPGETIEEAVAREVHEEAGIRVNAVEYVASQPWPFPSQLMIGCYCTCDDPAITIDRTELDDARWFSREELEAARDAGHEGTAELIFPQRSAIAHNLVTWWLGR
ncbi:NAD(+) diphosphatase [Alteripontixanthobacter maritimus]|uniref:NAD(+) diphosphatase n=1 Tax=Alteripontixanthobacter maritimus TaxID=2161824 RepID=A0A369Q530_9SPHN|nr:NAD(+) diphosphatase [Alteripontixanthobacter maritimus]RDC59582.1 NAD(+) diphosphatase [Alteripontixanthobacter maritimus]